MMEPENTISNGFKSMRSNAKRTKFRLVVHESGLDAEELRRKLKYFHGIEVTKMTVSNWLNLVHKPRGKRVHMALRSILGEALDKRGLTLFDVIYPYRDK